LRQCGSGGRHDGRHERRRPEPAMQPAVHMRPLDPQARTALGPTFRCIPRRAHLSHVRENAIAAMLW
jgi:hypothetical protein